METPMKTLVVKITLEQHVAVRSFAFKRNLSMAEIVRSAIEKYVKAGRAKP